MYESIWKRVFDIAFSISLLVILFIPMVVVAVVIRLTSPGKAIFKQIRYGVDSKPFEVYKFRTMQQDTPSLSAQVGEEVISSHMTPVGKVLRELSIDELPQIFNILAGQMSFIGPRPLSSADEITLALRRKNGADRVRPGITGLAQVNGRNLLNERTKAKFDAEYADNVSLKEDVRILLKTVKDVFLRTNIYR